MAASGLQAGVETWHRASVMVIVRARGFAAATSLRQGWVIAALATLVLLRWRTPQVFTHPQLWAEDGLVFYHDQQLIGVATLFSPYVGYLHLTPRLVALFVGQASAVSIPALYAGASVIIAMWSAATIATVTLPFAWVLGAMLILPPHTGEDFGTLTNVQWVMAPALALALCTTTPPSRAARINQGVFCILASLTGPFSVFLAPVALWRGWRERADAYALGLCLVVLIGAVLQLGLIVSDPVATIGRHDPIYVAKGILDRCIGQLATGHRTGSFTDVVADTLLVIAAGAALVYRRTTFSLLSVFLAAFLLTLWLRYLRQPPDTFDGIGNGDRYFFVPRLILLWAIAIVALEGRFWPRLLAGTVMIMVALNVSEWIKPPLLILPWREEAKKIDRGEAVRILINPPVPEEDGPWMVELPARQP